jgi:hypothetical protein
MDLHYMHAAVYPGGGYLAATKPLSLRCSKPRLLQLLNPVGGYTSPTGPRTSLGAWARSSSHANAEHR